jgi:hypothetical protein
MVDLSEIQAAYYMVAATGVLVAAIYYIYNMRISQRNTKIQLSARIADKFATKEYLSDYHDLIYLTWRDTEDFKKRFDSAVNKENYVKRFSLWQTYDNIGYQVREGLVDPYIVYDAAGYGCILVWGRYKPIIDEVSRPEVGSRTFENFEYLAHVMWRIAKERGKVTPGGKFNTLYDTFWDIFEPKPKVPP